MSNKTLFTATGESVEMGQERGRGGEGAVFDLPAHANRVAKVYHEEPNLKKQAKLRFMVETTDAQLRKYVAWPEDTLHLRQGGPVVGFIMSKVSGKSPIHMVYSPAHRRKEYPNVGWNFLLYVARNIAASFDTVHAHGHVIGDVNQNGVMVGADSRVALIDSDSFQVNARGELHLCEVGVSHFTPPELQSLASFNGFARTANHDNFGLALLIFHLLFGGRHPFSGAPLRNDVGNSLETDIKEFRYAYSRDSLARGFSPPPRSIPVSILPEALERMFQHAFTEQGASSRPSAQHWVTALDSLHSRLKTCSAFRRHSYPEHLSGCPWCSLENQGVVYFIDFGATLKPSPKGFLLQKAWALIEAEQPPQPLRLPHPTSYTARPQSLPTGVPSSATITWYKVIALTVAIVVFATEPSMWILALLIVWGGWAIASNFRSSERATERASRRRALETAWKEYHRLEETAGMEAGPEGFHSLKAELKGCYELLEELPGMERREIHGLSITAHERQKQKFLEMFFIDDANIPGVGQSRKIALRSFGIETAADVSRGSVMQVKGFGENLTHAILDWKMNCERKFIYNAAVAVTEADRNAVSGIFASKRITLERSLAEAPAELRKFRELAASRLTSLYPQLEIAARRVAQAMADVSPLS